MNSQAAFLRGVLHQGRICLRAAPSGEVGDVDTATVLQRAYDAYILSLAGPALPFDEPTARAAGRLLAHAAWYFLNPGRTIVSPETCLRMPALPRTPEQHLSADLVLRFLPTLHRRAKALLKGDLLPTALEQVLREWPLSGVLAEIVEPPLSPVDFGAHAGLHFLYAERLAVHDRPGWFPGERGMQYVELVWQQRGRDVSVLPALHAVAEQLRQSEG